MNERIDFKASLQKIILLILAGLVSSVAGIGMFLYPIRIIHSIAAPFVFLMGLVAIIIAIFISTRPLFFLDQQGIHIPKWRTTVFVPWSEITGVDCDAADEYIRLHHTLPDSPSVQVRHELDRGSQAYKAVFRQRTVTERINSQAVALGIERPKLRNARAIANMNTLIYVLINLRAYHRIRQRPKERGE